MRFQQEFARFYAAAEVMLYDATKSRGGFSSVEAADDALRVLEARMNEMDRAIVEIYQAIEASRAQDSGQSPAFREIV
jgi:hypothetical protein